MVWLNFFLIVFTNHWFWNINKFFVLYRNYSLLDAYLCIFRNQSVDLFPVLIVILLDSLYNPHVVHPKLFIKYYVKTFCLLFGSCFCCCNAMLLNKSFVCCVWTRNRCRQWNHNKIKYPRIPKFRKLFKNFLKRIVTVKRNKGDQIGLLFSLNIYKNFIGSTILLDWKTSQPLKYWYC